MIEFNDNPPSMTITPQSLAYFIRNGYELKLYNRRAMNATASKTRILIPIIPVIGRTLRNDYNFWTDGNWRVNAEEAGCVKVNITTGSDLMCEFKSCPGVLLQMPEVSSFVLSCIDMEAFYAKSKEILEQFRQEALADDLTKMFRSPMEMAGRNIHVGAMLKIIDFMERDALRKARLAFLDCEDLTKEGIRRFCTDAVESSGNGMEYDKEND